MKLNKQKGFTLIEMLVSASLFALAITMVSTIFVNANSLQGRTVAWQKLQNDGRYITEKIAREIRVREIRLIEPLNNPTSTLVFYPDENNVTIAIYQQGDDLIYQEGNNTAKLNAGDVTVIGARFVILPAVDSADITKGNDFQSRVTMMLKIKNKAGKYNGELTLQTTISSKIYKR